MGHSSPETSKVPGTKMIYRMFGVIETVGQVRSASTF